jgi:hypothetical protein
MVSSANSTMGCWPPLALAEIEWGKTAVRGVPETVQWSTADGSGKWFLQKSIPETGWRKLEEEICFAARRRGTERAETREEFEFDRVVSSSS